MTVDIEAACQNEILVDWIKAEAVAVAGAWRLTGITFRNRVPTPIDDCRKRVIYAGGRGIFKNAAIILISSLLNGIRDSEGGVV